jgi:hypothetical protein
VTGRRSFRVRTPLAQGVHSWQVTVLDRRGQQFATRPSTVRIDTVAPALAARVAGKRRAGTPLRLTVRASDAPPPAVPPAAPVETSGLDVVSVDWGDGTSPGAIRRSARHAYVRPGRYVVRVTALDRAGNRARVRVPLRIVKAAKRGRR